jgi:hypothetical protein
MTVKDSVSHMFGQIKDLLIKLNAVQYNEELLLFNGSSIGGHVRHIYDFYECILSGESTIDYNCRNRNTLIQTNISTATSAFDELMLKVTYLNINDQVKVVGDFNHKEIAKETVNSTIGRELMYAYDHSIHHLAIIKMGIRTHFKNVIVHDNLGVAPSTIRYNKTI